jgi:hypothetical protein
MNNIILIGTSFARNGEGVPDMNYTFRDYLSREIPIDSIDIYELSSSQFPGLNRRVSRNLFLFKTKQLIHEKFIHVLHPNDLFNSIPFLNFSKYAKKKIVTVHDFYPFFVKQKENFVTKIDDFLKRQSFNYISSYDHIFARTTEVSQGLQYKYGIEKDKITIQGPIIENRYSKLGTEIKNFNKVVIGYVNNFNWNKSQMLYKFITTFKEIKSNEFEFHIYGSDFPYKDEIIDDPRITYHGFLSESEVPSVMSQFDVYLNTSTTEGFGIPIAKAKAMKIPILCYDGNIPNITKRNTCLWDQHNLRSILENEEWKKIDIKSAYSDIRCLRPEIVVKQTIEVYGKVFS